MGGTFRSGDSLTVEPVSLTDLVPGDVVVFRELNHKGLEEIVHRVMHIRLNGLVVRGDNNPCNDPNLVSENSLVGRVSYVERDGKRSYVRGGRLGLLRAHVLHKWRNFRREMWSLIRLVGRNSYYSFRNSGLINYLWRPSIAKIQLMTEKGPLIKLVCRNHTVASYWVDEGRLKCRRPYDLVLFKHKEFKIKPQTGVEGR
jgi:hypothetical protein